MLALSYSLKCVLLTSLGINHHRVVHSLYTYITIQPCIIIFDIFLIEKSEGKNYVIFQYIIYEIFLDPGLNLIYQIDLYVSWPELC